MNAIIKPGYDSQRQYLKDVIPLSTPFTLFIAPSQLCNFKCHFCSHSLSTQKKKEAGFVAKHLDFGLFKKIVEQSQAFAEKYKRILLTGLGEPLMNPRIVEMVQELSHANVAENLEIFTNGSFLTHDLSDGLVEAGLTKLRISIQGTSARMYEKNCSVRIDFQALVDEIKYFYDKSRNKCSIYIKIIEEELEDENDKKKFFDIFGSICDEIYVENLVKAQPMMGDYDNTISTVKTFYGEIAEKREVCPYIFYSLQIDAEGNCFPCPPLSLPKSFSLGNLLEIPLTKIWYGEKHKELMISHLKSDGNKPDICKKCTNYMCFTPKEDSVDLHKEEIIRLIGKTNR